MSTLVTGADSSTPGHPLPRGTKILAGYIGAPDLPGQPDSRHVWTIPEWNIYLHPDSPLYGGPELRALPIFVHDYPGDPLQLANNACDAALDLGWAHSRSRLIAIDLETLVAPDYVRGLDSQIAARGFLMMKYGSAGYINRNPPAKGGTWMALLTAHRPVRLPLDEEVGQQWQFGPVWDLSVFDSFVYDNCGRGPRKVEA